MDFTGKMLTDLRLTGNPVPSIADNIIACADVKYLDAKINRRGAIYGSGVPVMWDKLLQSRTCRSERRQQPATTVETCLTGRLSRRASCFLFSYIYF